MDDEEVSIQESAENIEVLETEERIDDISEKIEEDNVSEFEETPITQKDDGSEKSTSDREILEDILKEQSEKSDNLQPESIETITKLTEFALEATINTTREAILEQTEINGKFDDTMKEMETPSEEDEDEDKEDKGEEEQKEVKEQLSESLTTKDSIISIGRGSLSYNLKPRIRADMEDHHIDHEDFFITEEGKGPFKFYKYMDELEGEEFEEESVSEEEERETRVDRIPYYNKYKSIMKDIAVDRLKNNILQKKMAVYYRRRKMDHVLKESDQHYDTQEKYGRKLDAYGELSEFETSERTMVNDELNNLKAERNSKFDELHRLFENLQTQEKNTGYGLIHTKTGNTIPDKLVDRLLHRQRHTMKTVGDMRLTYLQLKNMLTDKQNQINIIDKVDDNFYLKDYEQLKIENRSRIDKMEEKDEEIARIRNKCQKTIQILAHMREKSAALETDIYDITDELRYLQQHSKEARMQLNQLKQKRDYYRTMLTKLREDSGLLTESDLLRDMAVSVAELKSVTEQLESLKEENRIKAQQIRNIRKVIEFPPDVFIKTHKLSDKASRGKHIYKGRPSLHKPILPDDAFKHLKNFKGKPTPAHHPHKTKHVINPPARI